MDRNEQGRYRPGHKSTGGRPKGSRNEINRRLDAIAALKIDAIVSAMVDDAVESRGPERKLVTDRMWDKPKGRPVEFDLPPVETMADIPRALGAVLSAVAQGEITPGDANAIAATIAVQQRALQLSEFEARIESRIAKLEGLERERGSER